jgi:hypothetical protein
MKKQRPFEGNLVSQNGGLGAVLVDVKQIRFYSKSREQHLEAPRLRGDGVLA